MKDDNLLVSLFLVFAPLSLMAIGGGASILGELQHSVVDNRHWLTNKSFLDMFAISRVAPGPGTLIVTLMGWHLAGWAGAIVSTIAIFAPSSLLVIVVAHFWHSRPNAAWQGALVYGLAPLAAGLVLSSVFTLLSNAKGGWIAWCVAIMVAVAARMIRLGPLTLMIVGSVVFCGLMTTVG
ncbi:chromate transporter [Mesorhizobium sp. ESP6-5]|uniref:chromate transporter n=1 Tax=Mesorhizobium sp. ESP6-5 TaxID=2876623 RepID=UPI001CCDF6CB|nr:chromate transporter [Mesorhizobium sp. ESP6-5]MBZ9758226.1 chromate transporter [Mesorhizobium sp. ESP6-5]